MKIKIISIHFNIASEVINWHTSPTLNCTTQIYLNLSRVIFDLIILLQRFFYYDVDSYSWREDNIKNIYVKFIFDSFTKNFESITVQRSILHKVEL